MTGVAKRGVGWVRRRAVLAVAGGALLVAISVWVTTMFVSSPRQAEANAAAPAASLVSVPVESRVVGNEIVTRGMVVAEQRVNVISEVTPAGAKTAIVSGHVPKVGDVLKPGAVAVEVSGRPVLVLKGQIPLYRDLSVGDRGADVKQLQTGLRTAGASIGKDASGVFGEGTLAAVTKLYSDAGYRAPGGVTAEEFVFLPTLPALVASVEGGLGSPASKASVWLTSGDLVIQAAIPDGKRDLVRPGTKVEVTSEVLGLTITCQVAESAPVNGSPPSTAASGEPSGEPSQVADTGLVTIVPDQPIDGKWVGQDVRVRVVEAQTAGPVTAVPVAAILMDGSGQTEVVVVDPGATTLASANPRRVRVKVGVTGGGWVEVSAEDGQALRVGDAVAISDTKPK